MVLTARALGPGDAADWRALRLEAIRDFPYAFLSSMEEVLAVPEAEIAVRLGRGGSYGVSQDGALIGMAGLVQPKYARARHRGEIGGFYIRPVAQGQGAADALMAYLFEAAAEQGIWQLELAVSARNPRAIRFYERHGFVRQGRIPNAIVGEDGPEDDWFYARDLRPDS